MITGCVTLTPKAVALAHRIAHGRNLKGPETSRLYVKGKVQDHRAADFHMHLVGICGELAGAVALGAEVDETILPKGDDGIDMTAFGYSWQIRTSTYHGKGEVALKFNSLDDFVADAAMLIHSHSLESHEIMGIVHRKRFAKEAKIHDYGHGKRLIMPATRLTPLIGFLLNRQPVKEWVRDYESAEAVS